MLYRSTTAALTLAGLTLAGLTGAGLVASSAPSYAMMGIGCPDLPAYARAQGTLQMGEGACNMTTAEAMRIVRQERPDLYGSAPQARATHPHRRHHAND